MNLKILDCCCVVREDGVFMLIGCEKHSKQMKGGNKDDS